MSNELAITAVTIALRNYLIEGVTLTNAPASLNITRGLEITTLPLHKVRDNFKFDNVVNLLLYRTEQNAAWRNRPLPTQPETSTPPLPLDLEYLVTAYGEDEREEVGQYILGQAMRFLHDYPFIPRQRFQLALPEANVHQQIERVKVTERPLSTDELSKLWTVFQTQYRISAAYVATVVLIDSRAPSRSALPVLTRGKDDRGFDAIAGSPPSIDSARAASGFGAVTLGNDLLVEGQHLDIAGFKASVRQGLLGSDVLPPPVTLPVTPVDPTQVRVKLPPLGGGVAAAWPAGIYSIALVLSMPGQPDYATNEVPFALAPVIKVTPDVLPVIAGTFTVMIEATPQIRAGQTVLVLWDGLPIAPTSVTTPGNPNLPTTVKFKVTSGAGIHRVRLRVDGIDSILMKPKAGGGYEFDPAQSVEVLP